jgi:CHAT domain-containing protein
MHVRTAVAMAVLCLAAPAFSAELPAATPLVAGQPVEREIGGGKFDLYEISLTAGVYLELHVESVGAALALGLQDPRQEAIAVHTDGTAGETLYFLASAEGVHMVAVQSQASAGKSVHYTLTPVAVRPATAEDRDRVAAFVLSNTADRLVGSRAEGQKSLQEAAAKYEEALALYRKLGDVPRQARTLRYLGRALENVDENRALARLQEALDLAHDDDHARALTQNDLGSVRSARGEQQEALLAFQDVLRVSRAHGYGPLVAGALANIGNIHIPLHEYRTAIGYLEEALPLVDTEWNRAAIISNIGEAYSGLTDWPQALSRFDEALAMRRKVEDQTGVAWTLQRMAFVRRKQGDTDQALPLLDDALAIDRKIGARRDEARVLFELAGVYADRGDHVQALARANETLDLIRGLGSGAPESLEWMTAKLIGEIELKEGRLDDARQWAETAIAIVEATRSHYKSQGLKTAYAANAHPVYALAVDATMRLHDADLAGTLDRTGLELSERGHARTLVDMLHAAHVAPAALEDPELRSAQARRQEALEARAALQVRLTRERPDAADADRMAAEIRRLSTDAEELEVKLRGATGGAEPPALTVAEMQSLLDPDTVVLEYSLGPARSYLWAVTASSVRSFALPAEKEVEALAHRFCERLTERNRLSPDLPAREHLKRLARSTADYEQAARQLSAMLLGPVTGELAGRRVLVVPDGALHYVPFAALPVGAPARPLCARNAVTSLPSLTVLPLLRDAARGRAAATKSLAVFADPVFDKNDERVQGGKRRTPSKRNVASMSLLSVDLNAFRAGRAEPLTLPRLEYTRRLMQGVTSGMAEGDVLRAADFQASRRRAIEPALADYRTILFATHGLLNTQYPELSGIALSMVDEKGAPQDGLLRLQDVYGLRLNADLVVLGACETGLGKEMQGEGLVGLSRGFMYAGARRVLASLWKVDEEATVALLERFYTGVRGGSSYPAALRDAQQAVSRDPRWGSPYFWAGFVLQGDWR